MKYIAIRLNDNVVLSKQLFDSVDHNFMPLFDKYFLKVKDDYNTSDIFDNEPVVKIETEQDKTEIVTVFTVVKDYDLFNKWIEADKDNLIKQWCIDQGKSQAECIKENDSSYNTKLSSIITDQNKLRK